ncbi:hypothetical protein CFE70_000494 [Pyrenophora teres f. teres 0-1]
MDHSRDPCPWMALRDFGGAFCTGLTTYASLGTPEALFIPFPQSLRMANDAQVPSSPLLAGNFGVWRGLFSTLDCTVKGIRTSSSMRDELSHQCVEMALYVLQGWRTFLGFRALLSSCSIPDKSFVSRD